MNQAILALQDIAQYTGEGPSTTDWQSIVCDCSAKARGAFKHTPALPAHHGFIVAEVLLDIGEYTGEGGPGTPWQDIVEAIGHKARTALCALS